MSHLLISFALTSCQISLHKAILRHQRVHSCPPPFRLASTIILSHQRLLILWRLTHKLIDCEWRSRCCVFIAFLIFLILVVEKAQFCYFSDCILKHRSGYCMMLLYAFWLITFELFKCKRHLFWSCNYGFITSIEQLTKVIILANYK